MGMQDLNKDYILSLVSNKGSISIIRETIEHRYEKVIEYLKGKVKDDKFTIFQMEDYFFSAISSELNRENGYNYIYPYSYNTYDVFGISCYRTDEKKYNEKISKLSISEKKNYSLSEKKSFVARVTRYVYALEYYRTLNMLLRQDKVKMCSLEEIGWKSHVFRINDDVKVDLWTNFGYGRSSYFLIKLTYKDIDIIPYTHIVNYYYANIVDIIRCTESFYPERHNWEPVMSLVADAANSANQSTSAFIKRYIIEECRTMVSELRRLYDNPQFIYNKISKLHHEHLSIINVRDRSRGEEAEYGIYPDEVVFTFKCEKLTGALQFLDNLNRQVEFIPVIQKYIDELKTMNTNLVSEIDQRIPLIKKEIDNAENKKKILNNRIKEIDEKLKPHKTEIKEEVERIKKKKEKEAAGGFVNVYVIEREVTDALYNNNREYRELKDQYDEIDNEIRMLNSEVWSRESFINRLNDCRKLIEDKVISSVA